MMAPNETETYRHICSLFADSELGCVGSCLADAPSPLPHRLLAAIEEPSLLRPATSPSLGLVKAMQLGPQPFTACCLVKPDGVAHLPVILRYLHQVERCNARPQLKQCRRNSSSSVRACWC